MSLTHTPAHTTTHPDRFEDEDGVGYSVHHDDTADDPRGWVENEHAALWAYHQPRLGSSVAADRPDGNIAIDAFAEFYEHFDEAISLETTRRWLRIFHPDAKITVETHSIHGYSQSDWLDLVVATTEGYGTPESHAEQFRQWAFGDVWIVIPDGKPGISGIYADDAEEAVKRFRENFEDQPEEPHGPWSVAPTGDSDWVMVTRADGRAWRLHRHDADPEHRFTPHRLAAGWFGNPFAPTDIATTSEFTRVIELSIPAQSEDDADRLAGEIASLIEGAASLPSGITITSSAASTHTSEGPHA